MTTNSLYDEYYYSHDCGRPYQRDEGWLTFFDQIAKRIIEQYEPKKVLDAGCAWGFLVEAFRNRCVEAFGVDISDYAIKNVHPDIKPYCWIGSITEPLSEKYDLITCIEVLEHMPRADAEKAIENLCTHANEIIFSSTPFDYKEVTHVNVHDPEYWAEQFARHGFYRDMETDLSFITSWAVSFTKIKRTSIKLVKEYEHKFWQLNKENFDLRQLSIETQASIRGLENQIRIFGDQVTEKGHALAELTAQLVEKEHTVQALTSQVEKITSSKTWKAALLFRRIIILLAPLNSRRAHVLEWLIKFLIFPFRIIRRKRKLKRDLALLKSSGLFDRTWYIANNPDVAQAKVEPMLHYFLHGGIEGRDPSPNFSSSWYLSTYKDVKDARVNPLLHYVLHGREEGRATKPGLTLSPSFHWFSQVPAPSMFDKWIDANEPSPAEKEEQRAKSATFDHRPLISVVMPVWNTPPMMLDRAIKSVMDQTYDKWEFCIADGNSNPKTKRILTTWAEKDRRIKIKFLSGNMGIAVNLNEALSLAQGEFVAFLDHDDIIAPFALFEIVSQLQFSKDADIIYSDEDKTDEEERRFGAFFKPDFSPDYLVGVNYIPHFLVVRKSLGDQIAWFREGYEGAQDYDLILRLVEKTGSIAHIPKILYHWRIWDRSTAGSIDAKPYANTSGKKALQEHLNRIGLSAHVADGYAPTFYRAQYDIVKTPLISIIIASRNNASNLERCIGSIIKNTTYTNFEIVLIENGRKEKELFELNKKIKEDSRFHILHWQKPYNISRLNNWATKHARGEIFLFLNDNTQVINKDWLEQMLQFAVRPDVGGVGAKLYYPDGTIQHGGIIIGINGIAGYSHRHFPPNDPGYFLQLVLPHNVSAVAATCLMIRRKVFQEVSGFDKNFSFAFGDVDLCLRILQKGYLNVWTPYAELTLYEADPLASGLAIGSPSKVGKEREYFLRTWTNFIIRGDPYYNPNLTLESEDYSLNTSNLHKDSRSP